MTYNLRNDHFKSWDLQQANEKPMTIIENDDDQDIYISERSSVASSNDMNQAHSSIAKRLPTPTTSSILAVSQKQPHNLRYPYNELPENGVLIQRKEENKKKKDLRKAPPDQGNLVSFAETKSPELRDAHYPYLYYSKAKNPDWVMRHRQTGDSQVIPNESLDLPQHAHQPALTTSPIKPRQQPRKTTRHNHVPIIQSNQDKQRVDHSENNSTVLSNSTMLTNLTSPENYDNINNQKQSSSPKQYIPLKDSDHDEHRIQPIKRTIPQQRRKLKTENDWTDNYMQSLSNGRQSQDSNSLIITSNSLTNRTKNRSKISNKNSGSSDIDENGKYRHQHHSPYYHHHQNQLQSHNSPSIPSQQTYHHHHNLQQHLHVRRRPPSGVYLGSEFQLVDVSFKKTDRSSYIQQTREPCPSPISPIYNQTSHLPPIIRDHHQHKTHTSRFPNEYYGTLARQTHSKDWEEPIDIPKIYKPDSQTRFYDRYLHNIVDKRLAA